MISATQRAPAARLPVATSLTGIVTTTGLMLAFCCALAQPAWGQAGTGGRGNPVKALQDGILAVQRLDFAKARLRFEDVLDADRNNAMATYYLAVCDAHEGKADDALLRLHAAIAFGFPASAWKQLPTDPYFEKLAGKSEFTEGLKALVKRYEDRERGVLDGFSFDFDVTTPTEENYDLESFKGKPLVILFVDTRQQASREALAYTAVLHDTQPDVKFLGIAYSPGKERVEQDRSLVEFISDNIVPFPMATGSAEIRAGLNPFHQHPTLLLLDAKGVPRRIVEGLPKRAPLGVYERALKETLGAGGEVPEEGAATPPASRPKPTTGKGDR